MTINVFFRFNDYRIVKETREAVQSDIASKLSEFEQWNKAHRKAIGKDTPAPSCIPSKHFPYYSPFHFISIPNLHSDCVDVIELFFTVTMQGGRLQQLLSQLPASLDYGTTSFVPVIEFLNGAGQQQLAMQVGPHPTTLPFSVDV